MSSDSELPLSKEVVTASSSEESADQAEAAESGTLQESPANNSNSSEKAADTAQTTSIQEQSEPTATVGEAATAKLPSSASGDISKKVSAAIQANRQRAKAPSLVDCFNEEQRKIANFTPVKRPPKVPDAPVVKQVGKPQKDSMSNAGQNKRELNYVREQMEAGKILVKENVTNVYKSRCGTPSFLPEEARGSLFTIPVVPYDILFDFQTLIAEDGFEEKFDSIANEVMPRGGSPTGNDGQMNYSFHWGLGLDSYPHDKSQVLHHQLREIYLSDFPEYPGSDYNFPSGKTWCNSKWKRPLRKVEKFLRDCIFSGFHTASNNALDDSNRFDWKEAKEQDQEDAKNSEEKESPEALFIQRGKERDEKNKLWLKRGDHVTFKMVPCLHRTIVPFRQVTHVDDREAILRAQHLGDQLEHRSSEVGWLILIPVMGEGCAISVTLLINGEWVQYDLRIPLGSALAIRRDIFHAGCFGSRDSWRLGVMVGDSKTPYYEDPLDLIDYQKAIKEGKDKVDSLFLPVNERPEEPTEDDKPKELPQVTIAPGNNAAIHAEVDGISILMTNDSTCFPMESRHLIRIHGNRTLQDFAALKNYIFKMVHTPDDLRLIIKLLGFENLRDMKFRQWWFRHTTNNIDRVQKLWKDRTESMQRGDEDDEEAIAEEATAIETEETNDEEKDEGEEEEEEEEEKDGDSGTEKVDMTLSGHYSDYHSENNPDKPLPGSELPYKWHPPHHKDFDELYLQYGRYIPPPEWQLLVAVLSFLAVINTNETSTKIVYTARKEDWCLQFTPFLSPGRSKQYIDTKKATARYRQSKNGNGQVAKIQKSNKRKNNLIMSEESLKGGFRFASPNEVDDEDDRKPAAKKSKTTAKAKGSAKSASSKTKSRKQPASKKAASKTSAPKGSAKKQPPRSAKNYASIADIPTNAAGDPSLDFLNSTDESKEDESKEEESSYAPES